MLTAFRVVALTVMPCGRQPSRQGSRVTRRHMMLATSSGEMKKMCHAAAPPFARSVAIPNAEIEQPATRTDALAKRSGPA
jgi:hypothetical protein